MGKNRWVKHENIKTINNNGTDIEIYYSNHYNEIYYKVISIDNKPVSSGVGFERYENAVKSTESQSSINLYYKYENLNK